MYRERDIAIAIAIAIYIERERDVLSSSSSSSSWAVGQHRAAVPDMRHREPPQKLRTSTTSRTSINNIYPYISSMDAYGYYGILLIFILIALL